ncbi:MAG TPA: ATP-binding protein [Terriglobia bacterium]|nr:ATP-binding protein [Terriglobia bacterium]
MSIRLRLILWHSTVFFVGLVAFAIVVWIGTRSVVYNDTDTWLVRQAAGLDQFLRMETHGTDQAAVVEEAREFSTGLPQGSGIRLFDRNGVPLYSQPDTAITGAAAEPSSLIHNGTPLRMVHRRVTVAGQEFQFAMWRSLEESEEALNDLRFVLLMMIPVFLVASVGGGWVVSRRALRPVDEITKAARRISLQNLSSSLPVPSHKDELQRLCEAWNEMLHRLDVAAGRLRQFTADSSHELRTPVAFIRTTAELALRHPRSEEDYRDAIRKIRDKSSELTGIIESLMELARADAGQTGLSFALLDVGELVTEIRSEVEPFTGQKNLAWAVRPPSQELSVMGDRGALRRVLLALLDNAMKFTPASGRIELRASAASNEVVVEVEDSGIGISDQHLTRIFDRFYQVDPARSGGGVGLGLPMAQWIVQAHSGRIEVISDLQHGSIFRVFLPSAATRV